MTKALDKEICKALHLLGAEEKQSLLGVIKSFVTLRQNAAGRISLEQYNAEQDQAINRVKAGDFYTQSEAESEAAKW